MRILIACESSGTVRNAFRTLGHDAWSCDLLDADDGSEYHIKGDCLEAVYNDQWDMMIAHPPCTYLSVSGMHWTTRGLRDPQLTEDALEFARLLFDAPIAKICIENPVSIISSRIRKPDQIIQPYQFGHNASKKHAFGWKGCPCYNRQSLCLVVMLTGKNDGGIRLTVARTNYRRQKIDGN